MNQQINLLLISKYLSRFNEQVEILNDSGFFSINQHAEDLLIQILDKVYDCTLENVNYAEKHNYPSIDLRDKNKRIAFQVTATSTLTKVKDTLEKFIKYDLHEEYDELYIYILKTKKEDYNQTKIDQIIGDDFSFDKSQVLDKSDIYQKLIQKNDPALIQEVKNILEKQFSEKRGDKWEKYFKGLLEYDDYITNRFQYIDIKGFSPKIGSVKVQISLNDIYIPQTISSDIDFEDFDDEEKIKKETKKLSPFNTSINQNYVVILGDPGSGKSTMLRHITYSICNNRNDHPDISELIPVYIRASEYSKYFSNTQNDISEYLIDHHEKKFEKVFIDALEENNILLLFDGLDEIGNIRLRHEITDRLNRFISKYPKNKVIATSRKVGYEETRLGAKFKHFEIDDFDKEQIKSFAENWYISIAEQSNKDIDEAKKRAFRLYQSIRRNESVLRLAKNPLLMTIIALIDHQGASLPERRIELYEIATATFLENWVKRRKDTQNILFDKHTVKDVLSPIAFYMHENYSDGLINESEFRNKIIEEYSNLYSYQEEQKIRRNVNKLIEFLREDAGFIFEKGRSEYDEEGKFGFVHLTFQEYFTALDFTMRWKEQLLNKKLKKYVFDDKWHEVILLTASLFRQTEQTRIGKKSYSIH